MFHAGWRGIGVDDVDERKMKIDVEESSYQLSLLL